MTGQNLIPSADGPTADERSHRDRTIEGLRDLAAFLEANPTVPVPQFSWRLSVPSGVSADQATDLHQRAEVDRIADALGVPVCDQTPEGGHYIARKHFGPVTYEVVHVPAHQMARHYAARSYDDNVTLDGEAA
ncbi:hypothetical protein [Spirillospora sp. CA-128828]|uniref:hypothetical protein n=1 Tax=Spirillospora sp. CA-128828 TaxID=3240033 RepID=UPI003D93E437